jgi:hypothetical protein
VNSRIHCRKINEDIFNVFWLSVSGLLISVVYSTGYSLFTHHRRNDSNEIRVHFPLHFYFPPFHLKAREVDIIREKEQKDDQSDF